VKITKLSLAALAAMTLTTGAMAEVTTDLSGNVKLYYETVDVDGGTEGLFDQGVLGRGVPTSGASGQAAVSVEAKGKAGVLGYGFKYTAVDTLGLENNLVSGVRVANSGPEPLSTVHWAEKAFITYKMGNTLAKVGRQHLDTPLAFTEKWNIAANSFDAAVLINSDIENVTLVGAYVGRGNGNFGSVVSAGGNFGTFGTAAYRTHAGPVSLVGDGAYAFAALAKPTKELGVNAWYYNVQGIADAVWLDANYAVAGVKLGAIYAQMMTKGQTSTFADTKGFALKAGSKVGPVSLFAAYSSIDDDEKAILPIANVATGFKKTKLPTAGVYNDGVIVAHPGSNAFKIKAGIPVGSVKLTAQYISNTNDIHEAKDADEFDFIVATKIADINVKAIYVNRTFKNNAKAGTFVGSDSNHIRIIAGINF
jgi:hypothetical protein